MPIAAVILPLLAQYGPAFVTELLKLLKTSPEPTPEQWLTLLSHPSLTLTYDQQIEAARVRAAGNV